MSFDDVVQLVGEVGFAKAMAGIYDKYEAALKHYEAKKSELSKAKTVLDDYHAAAAKLITYAARNNQTIKEGHSNHVMRITDNEKVIQFLVDEDQNCYIEAKPLSEFSKPDE